MVDQIDGTLLSNKLKDFLSRKRDERQTIITKLKRKRKIIKVLYYTSTILAITISAILAAISVSIAVPPLAITILSTSSAILTAISTKFNFKDKSNQLCMEIEKDTKLRNKLDYIVSCNGNLTAELYSQILLEFK